MNGRNDRLDLRLNPLQRDYYFMKYEKSYVIHCKYACFHSLRLFSLSVCSPFHIQYQSTGVGLLPFLDKIESIKSIQHLFLSIYGTF